MAITINFPTSPNINDLYSFVGKTWRWDGIEWLCLGSIGAQGTLGSQGIQGSLGIQGNLGIQGVQGIQGTLNTNTLPAGTGSELQYRSDGTTFGAVTGSSVSGADITLAGTATATNFILSSDKKFKENIQTLADVEWTDKVNFVEYNFINTRRKRCGVLAQEIEVLNPELVYAENNFLSVSIIDILVAKIVRQDQKIEDLKEQINEFKQLRWKD